jgi:hypothetical protein
MRYCALPFAADTAFLMFFFVAFLRFVEAMFRTPLQFSLAETLMQLPLQKAA